MRCRGANVYSFPGTFWNRYVLSFCQFPPDASSAPAATAPAGQPASPPAGLASSWTPGATHGLLVTHSPRPRVDHSSSAEEVLPRPSAPDDDDQAFTEAANLAKGCLPRQCGNFASSAREMTPRSQPLCPPRHPPARGPPAPPRPPPPRPALPAHRPGSSVPIRHPRPGLPARTRDHGGGRASRPLPSSPAPSSASRPVGGRGRAPARSGQSGGAAAAGWRAVAVGTAGPSLLRSSAPGVPFRGAADDPASLPPARRSCRRCPARGGAAPKMSQTAMSETYGTGRGRGPGRGRGGPGCRGPGLAGRGGVGAGGGAPIRVPGRRPAEGSQST